MIRFSTRRSFLNQASLIALSPTIPQFLCNSVMGSELHGGKVLVVIQLDGGNDGINTIVPYTDEGYAKYRPKLHIPTDKLIKISDSVALHPSLRPAADLLEAGQLAIVQGVGYPNPNRSHVVSNSIWQTARLDSTEHKSYGWLGRATDEQAVAADRSPHAIHFGDEATPNALRSRRSTVVSLAHLKDLELAEDSPRFQETDRESATTNDLLAFARRASSDALTTSHMIAELKSKYAEDSTSYPTTTLASRLKSIAMLIKSGFSTSVYYAIQSGYDTHANQLPTHSRLLSELAGALKAFQQDLKSAGLDDRVLTICFSEFGRRVQEDSSLGTDHGTAGPIFLSGSSVQPGLVGEAPSLTDLIDGDLKMQFDFRRVYASVLKYWLDVSPQKNLADAFDPMPLIASRHDVMVSTRWKSE